MPPRDPRTVAVILTCHDRRETTLACLRAVARQTAFAGEVRAQVYLVDDGSTDGTSSAVAGEFPQVRLLAGDGSLFWNGGMRRAFAAAIDDGHDACLLLNDDTLLDPGAVAQLIEIAHHLRDRGDADAIVVGATRDPGSTALTYGGLRRVPRRPLKFERLPVADEPQPADTFNGNCVLIPAAVVARLGNLDAAFTHSMGDVDYGLRARRAGYPVWVAPGFVGTCSKNPQRGNWTDGTLPARERLRAAMRPKGLPPREWATFARRHGGAAWPLFWAAPYLRLLAAAARERVGPRRETPGERATLAILVNIVSPYRVPLFVRIGSRVRARVFVSGREANRDTWAADGGGLPGVRVEQSIGLTIPVRKTERGGGTFDVKWLHVNPGYLVDLVRTRPRAVISAEMGFRTLCALAYGTLFRRPVWVWWGGTLHTERGLAAPRAAVRWVVARWARRWISYGQTSTEYLEHLGVPRRRILQVQNCVDDATFHPRAEPMLPPAPRPVLLYVGQMIGRKGVGLLLESAARVRAEGLEFSLLLVGSGPERDALEARARQLGLGDARFLPAQPPERMAGVYRSADCLVFPTLEDVWGLVANEALLCGVPVLSSVYAGCTPEVIPAPNRFDPLDPADFDRGLRLAVRGRLAPADPRVLKTCDQVGDLIADEVKRTLAAA